MATPGFAGDQSLRPILGIAGSSLFGQTVVPAGTYALGAASVRSSIALLQSADGSLYVMALPSDSPQRIGSGVFPLAARILFSPNGQSALLLTPGAPTLTLITSLNSAPTTQALTVPGGLLSAAVSDSGAGTQVAIVSGTGPYTVAMLTARSRPSPRSPASAASASSPAPTACSWPTARPPPLRSSGTPQPHPPHRRSPPPP